MDKKFDKQQLDVLQTMDNRVKINGYTPIQALTMILSYHKGGYYEGMKDKDFESVVKFFVNKYM